MLAVIACLKQQLILNTAHLKSRMLGFCENPSDHGKHRWTHYIMYVVCVTQHKHCNETGMAGQCRAWQGRRVLHSVDQGEAPRCQLRRPKTLEVNSRAQISWPAIAELTFDPVAEREPSKSFYEVIRQWFAKDWKIWYPRASSKSCFAKKLFDPKLWDLMNECDFREPSSRPRSCVHRLRQQGPCLTKPATVLSFQSAHSIQIGNVQTVLCGKELDTLLLVFVRLIQLPIFSEISRLFESCWMLFAGVVLADDKLGSSLSHLAPQSWGHQVEEQNEISQRDSNCQFRCLGMNRKE